MATVRRKPRARRFVLCARNRGYEDLDLRKIYEQLPSDAKETRVGYVRVVDESGEDYLYPARCFVGIELSRDAERALSARVRKRPAA